ncbi:hypothetical protein WMF28_01755 [Sorangium sp. So ce590]|uniref:hypothetical protein n=1 Tax=Sorangium sp. So ce590 TaxID=3133317 RepID=UPI003F5FC7CE
MLREPTRLCWLVPLLIALILSVACENGSAESEADESGGRAAAGATSSGGSGGQGGTGSTTNGSGGMGSTPRPAENELFRLSTTHIEFDSRSDEYTAIVEVEALKGVVTVSAIPVSHEELGESHVVVSGLEVTDSNGIARVRVTKAAPLSLPPGVFRGQILVRGCSEGSCQELLVDITYTVVHVELVGHQGFNRADIVFRRRIDEGPPGALTIPMVASDGSAFDWSVKLTESSQNEVTGWLDFTAAGKSTEPLVLSPNQLFDRPIRLSAQLAITTEIEVAPALVIYDTLLPIEVSTNEVHLTANVGEQAEPVEFEIYDAYGGSYPWAVSYVGFVFGCPIRSTFIVELVEGSYDALPAVVSVTAPIAEQPTATPTECYGDLEIKHERTTQIVHQKVRVSLDVTGE